MNVFYIPSWYPSDENPIYGTFVKEQIEMLAHENPNWNLGVSLWGQGRPSQMLWVKDHVLNLRKILRPKSASSSFSNENITHYCYPLLSWTRKIFGGNLKGLIRANDYNYLQFEKKVGNIDIIHAQATYPAALVAQALSEKYGIPYVVSIRMSPFPFDEFLTKQGKLKALINEPLQKADALIATSHSLKNRMESFGLSKVHVIHNPVDTEFFQPSDYKPNELTILTVGRLEHQKGVDLLIDAIAFLGDEFIGKVRIGGDGSMKEKYQQLAKMKDVVNKIEWLNELSREQVRDEMQLCSFYVLPSRHETFGNVLLEAIASGKPVVATRCGGSTEIVTDKVGLFCENEDVEDLAEKIRIMVRNHENYSITTLREHTNDKFDSAVFSKNIEGLYLSLKS